MSEGAVTVSSLKKYATLLSQDASASKELDVVLQGVVQSLERTKREAFSIKDFFRVMYPMASDDELQHLIAAATRETIVVRSQLRRDTAVPTVSEARRVRGSERYDDRYNLWMPLCARLGSYRMRMFRLPTLFFPFIFSPRRCVHPGY